MATLTVDSAVPAGVNPLGTGTTPLGVAADVGLADEFANTGKELLVIDNVAGIVPCVVSIESSVTVDGQAVADRVVTVPTGEVMVIGPFNPGIYNDADGLVQISYDQVTDVYVAVLQVTPAS
jgi:hypothetical protein